MMDIDFTNVILVIGCGDNHFRKQTPNNTEAHIGNIHMLMKQTQPKVPPTSTTLDQ